MALVVPCNKGGVPHLTGDFVRAVLSEPGERLISVSVLDVMEFAQMTPRPTSSHVRCTCGEGSTSDSARELDFAHYAGLCEGFEVFLTTRSALTGAHATGPSTNAGIAGACENGRVLVGPKDWARAVATVRPLYACPIYDSAFAPTVSAKPEEGDASGVGNTVAQPPTKKRRIAASDRTAKWCEAAVQSAVPGTRLLLPLSVATEKGLTLQHFAGIVVDTVNHYESAGARVGVVAAAAAALPPPQEGAEGQRRVVFCQAESPQAMLVAVLAGATHVECGFPFLLAAKGIALTLSLRAPSNEGEWLPALQDMRDPSFRLDDRPLAPGCRCYACQRHSRAYLHHLLLVQEMNSEILLSIHNLTQAVDALRACRKNGASKYALELLRSLF
jgi:queuine tRNA-ribosyltransferase subunit QTRTD1